MIHDYYLVDSRGVIKERYRLHKDDKFIKQKKLIKAPDKDCKNPIYDHLAKEWRETASKEELLKDAKAKRIGLLREACKHSILNGFTVDIEGHKYKFSYDVDNQQNFMDTMRLFDNSMIAKIGWNAYLDGEKVRVSLDKSQFESVYLAGVKHKNDMLCTLNDTLIPMVNKAKTDSEISLINWSGELISDDFVADNSRTLPKRTDGLEEESRRNMSGVLELTNLIFMGGF